VSARLLATLCLVLSCVPESSAQSAASTDAALVVYLKNGGTQPAAPLAEMKRELSALMHQAGYSVQWRSVDADRSEDAVTSLLAVLELNGVCGIASGYPETEPSAALFTSLATTTVTDGHVLPFSSLNCTALSRSVSAALAKDAGARRDFLYGRAMARVVAHELYHVLLRTTEHARSGVGRSCFTTGDLLGERFDAGTHRKFEANNAGRFATLGRM
jgi:hypothetical protein